MVRAVIVWLLIMLLESIHGTLRTLYLEPWLGSFRARQVSVFTGCVIILAVTLIFVRWMNATSRAALIRIGVVWVILTLIFEFAVVGPMLGLSWNRMMEDYDLSRGGLMIFGLLFMLFAPNIAARIRGMHAA